MIGPGKYDDECTMVRIGTKALGVVLIVLDGDRGNGFSCQASPAITAALPAFLRDMADKIEADVARDIDSLPPTPES